MKALILLTSCLLILTQYAFGQSRGVWFWGSTTLPDDTSSPWGSSEVVGTAALEEDTINFLSLHHVDRVYGSYQNRPVSEPSAIASWNAKLDSADIHSQLLVSGTQVDDPAWVADLQVKIANRLIGFNETPGRLEEEKFDALHLDLEPQGLDAWDDGTPAEKRVLLTDLLNSYALIRTQLTDAGYPAFPIYADIPFTWDKLPVDGGSVDWTDATDRDAWFSDISAQLTGVSLMTFSKDNSAALQVATAYERSALAGKAIIAIQPKVADDEMWTTYTAFANVLNQLEEDVPTTDATDIENYAFWRHATTYPAAVGLHRGLWFWGTTTLPDATDSPYGSAYVVGDPILEDESINFFNEHGIKRIYGSYQNRPVSESNTIADWNAKLDAHCIQSQILFDGHDVNDPVWMTNLLNKITNRVINFNNTPGRLNSEKFDAVHLDLEPQGLTAWDDGTPAVKRALLNDLYQAYIAVRAHLDSAGFTEMPLYGDIPYTWDKLPWEGGSVGWAGILDRDQWFFDLQIPLDGVSIMTFSKTTFSTIDAAITYERTWLPGKARLGLQPKVGLGSTWLNLSVFNSRMVQCEANYGPTGSTDIENYGLWRYAIENPGYYAEWEEVVIVDPPVIGTGTGAVHIFADLGFRYVIHSSTDLKNWTEYRTVQSKSGQREKITVPYQAVGDSRFFQVEIIYDQSSIPQ